MGVRVLRPLLSRAVAVGLMVTVLLSGCTYNREEPGLFGRSPDPTTLSPPQPEPASVQPSHTINPNLPVVGQAVWDSADGTDVQLRIAVHAVRRIRGATVLDWSVTPLSKDGLGAGDPVPSGIKLGLSRHSTADINVFLVDGAAGRVYRPLTAMSGDQEGCLCTPIGLAEGSLRIGETRLLQVAYPALPPDVATVDVDITTVPMFANVPVTPVAQVPLATSPVDLARPADVTSVVDSTPVFRYSRSGQRFLISIDAVVAGSGFTSIAWTIQSATAGDGLDFVDRPPFTEGHSTSGQTINPTAASGPQLRLGRGPAQRVRLMTARQAGPDKVECLCTDLRVWATALRSASQRASVVTNLGPLPIGTQQVSLEFPGLSDPFDVPVTNATDATVLSAGPVPATSATWTLSQRDPIAGWGVSRWPTPLPDSGQVGRYQATVERLVR